MSREQVLALASQGRTRQQIADQLGIPYPTVAGYLKGLAPTAHRSWLHLYATWQEEYLSGDSIRAIVRRHGANTMSVRIALRGLTRAPLRVEKVADFFREIDTPEKAYFLGLFTADGSVIAYGKSQSVIQLALVQRHSCSLEHNEAYLINQWARQVSPASTVSSRPNPMAKKHPGTVWCLAFRCAEMAMDLSMHGIFPSKSHDPIGVAPSGVPMHLTMHFARGLLDGDGTIALHAVRKNAKTGYVSWSRMVQWCGSRAVLEWLVARLRKLGLVKNKTKLKFRMCHSVRIFNGDAARTIEAMYVDPHDLFLHRKWTRAFQHPQDWEGYEGFKPPREQQKAKPPGRERKYDYEAIRADRAKRMSFEEIMLKHGCSSIVVERACAGMPRFRIRPTTKKETR